MTQAAGEDATEAAREGAAEPQPTHPARELSLHLLRMLETRMEAAGLVIQAEIQRIVQRLQLKVLGAAALFIALWGGIVLLAIVLPENWRVPALAGVIVLLVALGVWAMLAARREAEAQAVGTMSWFLDGIRQDLEIFSRSLQTPAAEPPRSGRAPDDRGPNDIAA